MEDACGGSDARLSSGQEPADATADVSDAELAQCVAVLRRLHGEAAHAQFSRAPRFKPLRSALVPLIAELRARFFHGNSADSDARRQERKRKRKIERAREKAQDQQFINSTALRAERLARLSALTTENPQLAQVPDGVAAGGAGPFKLLRDGDCDEQQDEAGAEAEAKGGTDAEAKSEAESATLHVPRVCYTCKQKFKELHQFYDRLCPPCAALNYAKRLQTADLRGHVAIVTGARVKIGYEVALKLLRAGATVVATTRFPKDAVYRYAQEKDFAQWKSRLQIYGMDFRDLGAVDAFMDHIEQTFGSLDILINNATQTIRRPTHYYRHLIQAEVAPVPDELAHVNDILRGNASLVLRQGAAQRASDSDAGGDGSDDSKDRSGALVETHAGSLAAASAAPASVLLSQVPIIPEDHQSELTATLFPEGQIDGNKQQVDLRKTNSWVMKIDEIETMELVEVFAINAMAPFILNKRAIPLLSKSSNPRKFIINVSAMEGKFYRKKTPNHPHTNMAKAAVNMMTRTCAEDLAKTGIFMNSVDTGWINDENPRDVAARIASEHNFQTPLDEVDAAARVVDPIFALYQGDSNEQPLFGQFLKDFKISEW